VRAVTTDERRRRLARRHLLTPGARAGDLASVADAVVALHATDPVTVFLSMGARRPGATVADVERALYDERALVRHHAMRRTLWVMSPEVLPVAHAAATRKVAANERRKLLQQLAASGVPDPEGWLAGARRAVVAELHASGPMTARQLGVAVPSLTIPVVVGAGTKGAVEVAAHSRVLLVLGFDGVLVRARPTGSWINGQYRWALMDDWVAGGVGVLDERAATAHLVARWLRAFGPGTEDDLVWWTGLTRSAVRRALADAAAVEVRLDGDAAGWVARGDDEPEPPVTPWVALLPALDPTVMGWKQRDWYLDADHARLVFDPNGNAGPTVWVDGRVVGGWVQRPDGALAVRLLDDVGREAAGAVDEAAGRVEAMVGPARFRVRFPAPLQAELLGD